MHILLGKKSWVIELLHRYFGKNWIHIIFFWFSFLKFWYFNSAEITNFLKIYIIVSSNPIIIILATSKTSKRKGIEKYHFSVSLGSFLRFSTFWGIQKLKQDEEENLPAQSTNTHTLTCLALWTQTIFFHLRFFVISHLLFIRLNAFNISSPSPQLKC